MKRTVTFLAAAVLVLAAAPIFAAETKTGDIVVSANVAKTCSIVTNPLMFGLYDPLAAVPVDGTAIITVQCTKGDGTSVAIGVGAVGVSTTRAMLNGAAKLDYELYSDDLHTSVWSTVGFTAASKEPKDLVVYGQIPAGQDVPSGAYSDTVVATLLY